MKKMILSGVLSVCALFLCLESNAQVPNVEVKNNTPCIYEVVAPHSDPQTPCVWNGNFDNTAVQPNSLITLTVPFNEVVRVIILNSSQTQVAHQCGNQVTTGQIECMGVPVTVDFTQWDAVQIY